MKSVIEFEEKSESQKYGWDLRSFMIEELKTSNNIPFKSLEDKVPEILKKIVEM